MLVPVRHVERLWGRGMVYRQLPLDLVEDKRKLCCLASVHPSSFSSFYSFIASFLHH